MNPYASVDAIGFIKTFIVRLLTGEIFSSLAYDELQLMTLTLIGLSSALIGAFATLKKKAMLANALSHTALVGIVLAFLILGGIGQLTLLALLIGAVLSAILTSGIVWFLEKRLSMSSDGAIGLAFTALFSIGILLVTLLTKRSHIGLESVMGSADVLQKSDLIFAAAIFICSLVFIALFYSRLRLICFDGKFARTLGMRTAFVEIPFMVMLACVVMGGFRSVGAVMVLSYLVIPSAYARLFSKTLKGFLMRAASISGASAFLGTLGSRVILTHFALPLSTGALSSSLLFALYVFAALYSHKKRVAISSSL